MSRVSQFPKCHKFACARLFVALILPRCHGSASADLEEHVLSSMPHIKLEEGLSDAENRLIAAMDSRRAPQLNHNLYQKLEEMKLVGNEVWHVDGFAHLRGSDNVLLKVVGV